MSKRSLAPLAFAAFAALGLFAAVVAVACGGTTSDATIAPITGVVIRAEGLTAGRGCGAAPGQVFKYAAVVFGRRDDAAPLDTRNPADFAPLTAAVYDCFADGAFVQLPVVHGSVTYRIELYIYDEPAYSASAPVIASATDDISLALDAAAIPSAQGGVDRLRGTKPLWTTTCSATQQQDVEVLATCDPIAVGLGGLAGVNAADAGATGIDLATSAFALADGGTASCASAGDGGAPPTDAGADAGDDAGDAGDAGGSGGSGDASAGAAGASFETVRVTPRDDAGAPQTLACPDHFRLDGLAPVVSYALDVTLLRGDGTTLGQTVCTALTRPGETSSAACEPVR